MYSSCPLWRLPLLQTFYSGSHNAVAAIANHTFSTFCCVLYKAGNNLPPRPTLADADIKETYVKGTGPGGQKINKTNSAAQLTHIPTGIVVKCQATRSKNQNYSIARRLLAEKVEVLQKGDDSRAAKVVARQSKKKRSADKKKRRKYRELAEASAGEAGNVDANEGEDNDEEEEEDDDGSEESVIEETVDDGSNSAGSDHNKAPKD